MRALVELLFPAVCGGCSRPGAIVCPECAVALGAPARLRMPTPCPPGLPPAYSVADYADPVRRLLLAYKEHEAMTLRRPLAAALATATAAAAGGAAPVALVPVPSARNAVKRRGFDPVGQLTQSAARLLRDVGIDASVVPLLAHTRRVADSAHLTAEQRMTNLEGALSVARRLPRIVHARRVVIVDDVLTTGATSAEAARALAATDVIAGAVATIAATVRRQELAQPGLHKVHLGDYRAG